MECLNHIWKEVSWRMVMVDCWGCWSCSWSWSWCLSSHPHLTSTWILQLIFKNNLPAPASVSELHLAAGTKIFFLQYLKGGRSNSEMWDVKRITRQKVRQGLICARAAPAAWPRPRTLLGKNMSLLNIWSASWWRELVAEVWGVTGLCVTNEWAHCTVLYFFML